MGNTSITVKCEYLRPGAVDEAKYSKFVERETRGIMRAIARGSKLYEGWTADQARAAAESVCRCYRHNFRVLVPASPTDPR